MDSNFYAAVMPYVNCWLGLAYMLQIWVPRHEILGSSFEKKKIIQTRSLSGGIRRPSHKADIYEPIV
jgi:hypothetical protein